MAYSFMVTAILAVILPCVVYFLPPNVAWVLSIAIMVCFGISMALTSSGLAGLAGVLPPKYMSSFMLGISLNAVGPLIVRIVTLASFGIMDQVKYFFGALIFFVITALYLVICCFIIHRVIRQNVVIFNMALTLEDNKDVDEDYGNQYVHNLMEADNTLEFNEAVFKSL